MVSGILTAVDDFLQKIGGGKFLSAVVPLLNSIDSGVFYRTGFKLLYAITALICLLVPIVLMISGIANSIFEMPFGSVFVVFLVWLILTFALWLGFQVWWNRMRKIDSLLEDRDDFLALPLVADYVKTSGEVSGVVLVGAGVPIFVLLGIATIFDETLIYILSMLDINFTGIWLIIASLVLVVLAFVYMLFAKFIAEMIMALGSIANNTKKTAKNTEK
jgi:hypothetical protein